jgi:type IV secretion system protein VirD4
MKDQFNNAVGPQVRGSTPKAGKLIPALVVVSLAAGLQSATQFFAHDFGYQAALGRHFEHLYVPWSILQWAGQWYGQYPEAIMRAGSVGMIVTTLGLLGLAVSRMVLANSSRLNPYLHGSARWANLKDIQASGLLPRPRTFWQALTGARPAASAGVYVGAWLDPRGHSHYLRHNGPEHVLCYAPTRSGKGVGLVVPTLLSWGESAVITDLKGELWALTAGWRRQHAKNQVLRFEPAAASGSVCWNPLDEIRIGTEHEVGDVQNLATLIVDPDGRGLESHWQKTSQALLVGVILHALYKAANEGTAATLPAVDALLADPDRDVAELWMEMRTYGHLDGQNHPAVGSAARDMMDRPDEEAGSVLSTAKSYLACTAIPSSRATSASPNSGSGT